MKVTDPPGIVLEGFAGPGGWSTGLAMLPTQTRTVGVEWDKAACKTAHAAGHTRVRADVARFDLTAFAGLVWLLIMSPPCQAWSRSGKRRGILDQEAIFRHAMRVTTAGEWIDYTDAGPLPRRPATVETVAPAPEEMCSTCGHPGWAHDQGGFCAFCFDACHDPVWGVDGPVEVIEPVTVDEGVKYGDEGGTWHDARSPLVLEVLRWVLAVRPANICLEQVPDVLPFWELIARWLRGQGYSVWAGCLSSERYGVPQTRERAILIASRERAVSAPPATHTAYDSRLADGGKWHGTDGDLFGGGLEPWVSMAEAIGWGWTAGPAWTVMTARGRQTGHDVMRGSSWRAGKIAELTHGPDWLLHTNRGQEPDGTRQVIDPTERPAPPLTAKSGGQWVIRQTHDYGAGMVERHGERPGRNIDEPSLTVPAGSKGSGPRLSWVHERPATTVQGDLRIAQPGHRDREGGERQFEGESVRVTVQEAAILQSFPPDYPWQGTKSAQFRQVGDAVPPLLAAHVIATCLGVQVESLEDAA